MPAITAEDPAAELLSVKQAAKWLGIGERTLYRQLEQGQITCVRVGTRVLFDRGDLAEFVDRNRHRGPKA